ncbi:MAG: PleD family two-component system response regulator [Anaerolineales bacterium]
MTPKILVIEDDVPTTRLLSVSLARRGYEVVVAENGQKALDLIENQPPSLVLLDLMLPGISGFELLAHLKRGETTRDIPVIVVSANTQVASKEQARELGADLYLTKPYRLKDLVVAIQEILGEQAPDTN